MIRPDRSSRIVRDPALAPWMVLALVVLAWAVIALPNAGFRSLHWEEGRHAMATQAILADGAWLRPMVLGLAYIEKPPLLYWLAAAVSWLLGGVGEWTMRATPLLAVLATALMVAAALRPLVRPIIAVGGGIALMLTPMVTDKIAVAEPDTLVMVFSFASWLLWLGARDGTAPGRLVVAGLALACAGMAKHPTALGYVGAGGMLLVIERRGLADWLRLAAVGAIGLAPVLLWLSVIREPGDMVLLSRLMRVTELPPGYLQRQLLVLGEILIESAPWVMIALPALVPSWRRRLDLPAATVRAFAAYALACPIVVLFWPMTAPRYAMPSEPAVAILAMLVLDRLWHHGWVRRSAMSLVVLLAAAHLAWRLIYVPVHASWALASRQAGAEVNRISAGDKAPVFVLGPINNYNAAWYVRPLPRHLLIGDPGALPVPCWVLTSPIYFDFLAPKLPAMRAVARFPELGGVVLARISGPS